MKLFMATVLSQIRISAAIKIFNIKGIINLKKMKILRILEISWLIIAIGSLCAGIYKLISAGLNQAVFILQFLLLHLFFL